MNPQGQGPQQGQAQGQPAAGQQPRGPPMYQPNQIRSLPMLSEEEKNKYEQGLRGLWNKANNSPANSPDQIAARQKIIEFSKMLISKIQQRRTQAQQQAAAQQQLQGGQAPARPPSGQQNAAGQAAPTLPPQGQQQQQQQQQQKPQQPAAVGSGAAGQAGSGAGAPSQAQNPQAAAAAAAAAQRQKIPDGITQHVNKMTFRPPTQLANKSPSPAEVAKWVEDIKEKYAKALFTMESSKSKVAGLEKMLRERAAAGKPLGEEENKQYQLRREQQLKFYADAHKWVESVRKQQESLQGNNQQAAAGQAAATGQPADNNQGTANAAAANRNQNTVQNAAASVNAAVEAAKNQQQNRVSPANGTSTPTQAQAQPRPPPQQGQQPQGQQQIKTEQPHPPPVNTAQAQAAAQAQAQAAAGRVPTPQQSNTPVTAGGPTRALSHSAAMTLANQRAAGTPNSAPGQAPQPGVVAAPAAGNNTAAMNQGTVGPGAVQQQQGHPHAHPTQQQTGFQAKMPIPKQLPERATAVPQGVAVGGGVSAGRPTMSQGSGTLGGVMNQPPVARIPAYSHDAEGDHVLSKKKLDELVKQVVGATGDTQDGNMLTPEVEESVLNMADSFVDNVLHVACRNAKERGSKVLEIRDIQLVVERTYNIRVPGYSSDELRTVRKVQPSPGWIAKMSAVQAAKVMPGKGDL